MVRCYRRILAKQAVPVARNGLDHGTIGARIPGGLRALNLR